jgi:hypothetical protein
MCNYTRAEFESFKELKDFSSNFNSYKLLGFMKEIQTPYPLFVVRATCNMGEK